MFSNQYPSEKSPTSISPLPVQINDSSPNPNGRFLIHLMLMTCLYLVSSFFHCGHPLVNIHGQKCEVQYTTPALPTLLTTTASSSPNANLTNDKMSHHKMVE
jgi:hypothetical protein